MSQNKAEDMRARRRQTITTLLIVVLTLALAATCVLLPMAYTDLRSSIQQERMDYVDEISSQLISCHRFMTAEFSQSVQRFSGIINRSRATSLSDIAACFTQNDASRIMLISDEGRMNDLTGRMYFSTENQLIADLSVKPGVTQVFASLNNERDFWLFAAPIEHLSIDGALYTTVVMAVPADEFAGLLAVSLFDSHGASYIIKKGGSIEIKPENVNIAFGGYNLFSSLSQHGATDDQVEALRREIENVNTGSLLMEIEEQEWLFGYSGIDDGISIVVAIPLTLTAAKTYLGLANTIVMMATAILLAGLIALLFMLQFFYRDKERSKQALAAAAKSSFFSKMSHDIRTPLNAIMGLQALIKDSRDLETAKYYNDQSSVASAYLLGILNDVLDMTRIESGGMPMMREPFDMNELLKQVNAITSQLALEKSVSFVFECGESFDNYYIADAVRVKQVMINLLNNAVKFTPRDGIVTFRVSRAPVDNSCDNVTFVVIDTGIGISREYLPKVFTPFEQERSSFTQQYSGSGLGLAIVKSLVNLMNGSITVDSERGRGTVFTVIIPFERAGAIDKDDLAETATDAQMISFSGRRVLLAEDNSVNQMVASRLLSGKFGIIMENASDGEQALDMFTHSEAGYYDLILMDIKMPYVDGLEAARAIRALPRPDARSIPIVALSANAYVEDIQMSIQAGMNDHLSKPIDVQALSNTLQKYLGHVALENEEDRV